MAYLNIELMKECLKDLSDPDLLRRGWVDGTQFLGDPTELLCQLFDDTGLGAAMESGYAQEKFGSAVVSQLQEMEKLLNEIIKSREVPTRLLESEQMQRLHQISANIRSHLG